MLFWCVRFNSLEFKTQSVMKYSPYHIIDGEAYWYKNAPEACHKFIPALVSSKIAEESTCFIELERLAGPTLSHLYTNCCMTPGTLRSMISTLHAIHEVSRTTQNVMVACQSSCDFALKISRLCNALWLRLLQSPCSEQFPIDIMSNYIPKVQQRCKKSKEIYDMVCGEGWSAVRDEIIQGLQLYEESGIAKEGVIHGVCICRRIVLSLI